MAEHTGLAHVTAFPEVNDLLAELLSGMQDVLGAQQVGLYLYGSLVTGDFDMQLSDIDLLAVTTGALDEKSFDELNRMHDDLVTRRPHWNNRLEIAYVAREAMAVFKTERRQIAVISPGKPFHFIEAGIDWLMNWYMVREKGVTLFGPSPRTIIPPISNQEFVRAVADHARAAREWVGKMRRRAAQAYVILTLCRALYTCTHGEQVSKERAARWAQGAMPEWADAIARAIEWRRAYRFEQGDYDATFPETVRFVHAVNERIAATCS